MTQPSPPGDSRLYELLADRALFGLEPEDQAELDRLLTASPAEDPEGLDRLAAAVACSFLEPPLEPLPAELQSRIALDALRQLPAVTAAVPKKNRSGRAAVRSARTGRRRWLAAAGLLVAAAGLLGAAGLWWRGRPGTALSGPAVSGPAEQRQAMMAQLGQPGSDVLKADLMPPQNPAAVGVTGDLVWSTAAQKGFLRVHGLRVNDPSKDQYQLWIFDQRNGQHFAVDGGVFDSPTADGDVIVPISPKLRIAQPVVFAVTLEKAGGVKVANPAHLLLLARVPGAPKP